VTEPKPKKKPCPDCGGTPVHTELHVDPSGAPVADREPCATCGGTGEVDDEPEQ